MEKRGANIHIKLPLAHAQVTFGNSEIRFYRYDVDDLKQNDFIQIIPDDESQLEDFASMTWAFATLFKLDEQVFAALALEAKLRMSEFSYRNSPTQPGHSRR